MNRLLHIYFLNDAFQTTNVLTWSSTASHTLVEGNLNDGFNMNDRVVEGNKLQALDEWAVALSTLKLLEDRKCDPFHQPILATKARDPSACFYECDDGTLSKQYQLILGPQEMVIPYELRGRLCIMTHQHKLESHLAIYKCILPYSRPIFGRR